MPIPMAEVDGPSKERERSRPDRDQNGLLYLRQLLAEIKQSAVAEKGEAVMEPH